MQESYKIHINEGLAKAAVLGGVFLGGGGGGSVERGLNTAKEALAAGELVLVSVDYLDRQDIVITASAVGSPASKDGHVSPEQVTRSLDIFRGMLGRRIGGVITNENGGHSTTNGWLLSAMAGIPLIDAPCNGRAHPTGMMGSMGLSRRSDYQTIQVALGGNPELDKEIEVAAKGSLASTSQIVRRAAVEAGGLVTVLRNPVEAEYVRQNAAVGGLKQAIEVGKVFVEHEGDADRIIGKLGSIFPVEVLAKGIVKSYDINIQDGFDVGSVAVASDEAEHRLTYWNEYMTAEQGGRRLATFPDLIATMDAKTGAVLTSAEIRENDEIIVVSVNRNHLRLGQGMFDKSLFVKAEEVLEKELIKYVF